jgi:hypothetical protein
VRPAGGSPTCPTARGLGYATSIRTAAARKLVEIARANLQRWLGTSRNAALLEWRRLLDTLPQPELLSLLRSRSVSRSSSGRQDRTQAAEAGPLRRTRRAVTRPGAP